MRDPRFEKRYTEVLDAISDHWRDRPCVEWLSETMLQADPPGHTRLRRKVVRFFTPRTVQELRPRVEASVNRLLDEFAATAGGDLIDRIAFRLPITVICELLGIPPEQGMAFREPTLSLTATLEIAPTSSQLDAADRALGEMYEAFAPLLEARRARPENDLLSALVRDTEDPLTPRELLNLTALLFVAGFETTTNLIGNGVLALLDQPEQWDLLRSRPDLAPAVTDELLRHGGTVQLVSRVATEDVAFGDTVIPAGSPTLVVIAAANRDPARYPEPDLLDFTRTDIRQLSFGGGVHLCLGAALADLEITVLFAEMARRFERLELTAYAIAFEAGEVMIAQGADSSEAFVIIEGSATVDIDGAVVGTVSMDQIVGERGVVEGRSRAATVTVDGHLLAYAVSRDRLSEVMEANPGAAAHMRGLTAALYGSG